MTKSSVRFSEVDLNSVRTTSLDFWEVEMRWRIGIRHTAGISGAARAIFETGGLPKDIEITCKLHLHECRQQRLAPTCFRESARSSKPILQAKSTSPVEISSCSPTRRQRTSRTRCPSASPRHASGTTDRGHRALLLAEKEVGAESADGVMIPPNRLPIITASPSKIIGAAECSGRRKPSRYG